MRKDEEGNEQKHGERQERMHGGGRTGNDRKAERMKTKSEKGEFNCERVKETEER